MRSGFFFFSIEYGSFGFFFTDGIWREQSRGSSTPDWGFSVMMVNRYPLSSRFLFRRMRLSGKPGKLQSP